MRVKEAIAQTFYEVEFEGSDALFRRWPSGLWQRLTGVSWEYECGSVALVLEDAWSRYKVEQGHVT